MRKLDLHYQSGWDFLDDYKLLLGAVVVPINDVKKGDTLVFCCRFGASPRQYRWPAHVQKTGVRTSVGELGALLVFAPELRDEIERVAWAHAQGDAKRRESRMEPPVTVELICEHPGQDDAQRVVAVDISMGGCKLRSDELIFGEDEEVILTWTRGKATGKVRWVDGRVFGVSFNEPLSNMRQLLALDVS